GRFVQGTLPTKLIKGRYGQPILTRIYNNLPRNRNDNEGFGRNESQLHFHNAHNGAESDGAAGAHHFPGTFYDYRWSTTLARPDNIITQGGAGRSSGPNCKGGVGHVAREFRELQGTMFGHDHRFFFSAEYVYKGNLMIIFFFQAEDGIRDWPVTGVQTCALPICQPGAESDREHLAVHAPKLSLKSGLPRL